LWSGREGFALDFRALDLHRMRNLIGRGPERAPSGIRRLLTSAPKLNTLPIRFHSLFLLGRKNQLVAASEHLSVLVEDGVSNSRGTAQERDIYIL
jgi:hypothetical protein